MASEKIDFAYVREHADFHKVCLHFGVELEKDGQRDYQYKGICPFHDDHNASLKVHTGDNKYHCFPCGAKGNIVNFARECAGYGDNDFRKAARLVATICDIELSGNAGERRSKTKKNSTSAKKSVSKPEENDGRSNELIKANKPLEFVLKTLNTEHPFFDERGIYVPIIRRFGLGIATRSKLFKDRLVIPLHNSDGELVAYCGRYPSKHIPENEPKYRFPPEYRKEFELFNWHRCKEKFVNGEASTLILVESFFSVFHMDAHFQVCALMGRSLSEAQCALIENGNVKRVVLLTDGDVPGRDAIPSIAGMLAGGHIAVYAPQVADDFKPHKTKLDVLKELVQPRV